MSEKMNPKLEYLFERYFEGTYTQEEEDELLRIIVRARHDEQLKYLMDGVWKKLSSAYQLNEEQSNKILSGILPSIGQRKYKVRKRKIRLVRWSAAAVLLILLTAGWMWYMSDTGQQTDTISAGLTKSKNDIPPGGNKAILTLANGKRIPLNTVNKGMVSLQGNAKIIKLNNGQLVYNKQSNSTENNNKVLYNTITTPRGGQYQVILSDGTKVWLNAASSIRFPSEFIQKSREVQVTGEAYFEVAQNANKPFKVIANGMAVHVLGTHFNIMTYKNEPVSKVTLLEGAVRVTKGDKSMKLEPGQQAQLDLRGRLIKEENVDIQGTIAWKNNRFWFNDDDIQTVMRKMERWYDADITVKGNVPQHFVGSIPRDVNVSKVFDVLQATSHLDYTIKGDKIIVSPTPSTSPAYRNDSAGRLRVKK